MKVLMRKLPWAQLIKVNPLITEKPESDKDESETEISIEKEIPCENLTWIWKGVPRHDDTRVDIYYGFEGKFLRRFCLDASDGCVLARPGERLGFLDTLTLHLGVMIWGAISYGSKSTLVVIPNTLTTNLYASLKFSLSNEVISGYIINLSVSKNSLNWEDLAEKVNHFAQWRAQNIVSRTIGSPSLLYSVDMLPWCARSSDLSPIEHIWDIIEQQQPHLQPALTQQIQQAWN
ncbi:uncharacterized protein TNCV_1196291 [Trichonephila clavipes]|uniref:Uncharacterized protein n=1 Tax=Trichonephila clavipes TaxID=2585209 RepID=A0A8X6VDV8_TRICX|nr:uncharacterized protein TNCV_1196291 [Trichonephila clavipes]